MGGSRKASQGYRGDRVRQFITAIPNVTAKVGFKFSFYGLPPECKGCRLYNLCSRLRKGCTYEVIEVRNIKHPCRIHDLVRVVKVVMHPIKGLVSSSIAVEGMVITYEGISCEVLECPYYDLCSPLGLLRGEKIKIIKVLDESVRCPKGKTLRLVLLEPL
ncbi:MAG: hypothetical protein DRM97_07555 [Thermoprotei archaeon]|nr:MAG: hypothetical protein DRM97_07555 [Thermoprotei archaeon]